MGEDLMTRRDRKRLANREAIRGAALRLFMDRGFDAVSVDQVAEAADVSPSTTKEDLVLGRLAERQAELIDLLDERPGGTTIWGLLWDTTMAWLPAADQQRLLRSEVALMDATPALMARLHQMMADWEVPISARLAIRCGRPATDLELRQLTALYCATIRIVIREWAAGNTGDDIADFGRDAVEALRHLPASALPVT
jgi:AcrR family transcriptional regulator